MQASLEAIFQTLTEREERQSLSPKLIWNAKLEEAINALPMAENTKLPSEAAMMAGLHLLNDSLNASHSYAQLIEDNDYGAYWHGLMHRMERDFSNSKYWFRRAGNHPVKEEMREAAAQMLQNGLKSVPEQLSNDSIVMKLIEFRDMRSWNSNDFVDLIALQEEGDETEFTRVLLEQLQWLELVLLLRATNQWHSRKQ